MLQNPFETDQNGVEWHHSAGLTPYPAAVAAMEARVARIAAHEAAEAIWLLEHLCQTRRSADA